MLYVIHGSNCCLYNLLIYSIMLTVMKVIANKDGQHLQ